VRGTCGGKVRQKEGTSGARVGILVGLTGRNGDMRHGEQEGKREVTVTGWGRVGLRWEGMEI